MLLFWRSRDNDKYCIKCNVIVLKLYLVECGRGGGGVGVMTISSKTTISWKNNNR